VKSQLAGSYGASIPVDIPPKATADVSFSLQLDRSAPKPRTRLTFQIGFVDHYGNKNWHAIVFRPIGVT